MFNFSGGQDLSKREKIALEILKQFLEIDKVQDFISSDPTSNPARKLCRGALKWADIFLEASNDCPPPLSPQDKALEEVRGKLAARFANHDRKQWEEESTNENS